MLHEEPAPHDDSIKNADQVVLQTQPSELSNTGGH